ncbi:MAG: hypothetical protein WCA35_00150 [Kovacikia sp.]
MARALEANAEFLKPSSFDALKLELSQLESVEPGSKSVAEAIQELMPLIKGCRDRGHSWNRICLSFQKFVPEMTVGTLRKYAFEFDPSLKGALKGSNESTEVQSVIPNLENQDEDFENEQDDEQDDGWPPSEVVKVADNKTGKR